MGVGFLDSCCSHYVLIKFSKGFTNTPVVTGGLSNGISHITRLHAFECGRVVDSVFRAWGVLSPPPRPLNHDSRNFPVMLKIYDGSDMIEGDKRATHPPMLLM